MTETTITVRGSARAEHEPDRAEVRFAIAASGADREPVLVAAQSTADRIGAALAELHDDGRLDGWSLDDVRVHSEREWVGEDRAPVLRHRATVWGSVRLDGDRIATLPEVLALLTGEQLARVEGVDWSLVPERREAVLAEVRDAAVGDAVAKATAYGRSIGRPSIEIVALADPGMLSAGGGGEPRPQFERAMMLTGAGGGAGFELRPESIEVAAQVELRAIAR